MVLSSRRRRSEAALEVPLAPIQFRLEAHEERVSTDDGQLVTGRGYLICDPHTGAPLGEDDFFFRIGGGIVCDLVGSELHAEQLQANAFRPGRSLALRHRPSTGDLDPAIIEIRDATGVKTVGLLPSDVADAVSFYGTETYGAAFCLWEWRTESGYRFGLRLLLAPGWTVEQIPEESPTIA